MTDDLVTVVTLLHFQLDYFPDVNRLITPSLRVISQFPDMKQRPFLDFLLKFDSWTVK